jgi:hypothetical protein
VLYTDGDSCLQVCGSSARTVGSRAERRLEDGVGGAAGAADGPVLCLL